MVDELTWDETYKPDRGKVLSSNDLDKMDEYFRYLDTDGDHIPYRTLPGTNPKGAYFLRGSGHNKYGRYTEISEEYQEVVDRLLTKWKSAANHVPQPIVTIAKTKTKYGVIAIGSSLKLTCLGKASFQLNIILDNLWASVLCVMP